MSEQVVPFTKRAQDAEYADAIRAADELLDVLDELEQEIRRARSCAHALPSLRVDAQAAPDDEEPQRAAGSQAVSHAVDMLEAACLEVMTQLARYRAAVRTEVERPAPDLGMLSTGSC